MSEGNNVSRILASAYGVEMTFFLEGYNYSFTVCWTKLQIIHYSEENDVFYYRIFT